jgi:hypothetical protein
LPRRPETPESAKLGEEYLRKRNALLDLMYKREAMLLARDRGQLIERELIEHQLACLMFDDSLAPEDFLEFHPNSATVLAIARCPCMKWGTFAGPWYTKP